MEDKNRVPDKLSIFIPIMPTSSLKPMFDHLLESSRRDDSIKWSNMGFDEEMTQVESIEVHFMHLIWGSENSLPSILCIVVHQAWHNTAWCCQFVSQPSNPFLRYVPDKPGHGTLTPS